MSAENEKKNDRKIYIKFAVALACCFLLGSVVGKGARYLEKALEGRENIFEGLKYAAGYILPALFIAMNVIVFTVSMVIYGRMKKLAMSWDGEDEDVIGTVEYRLNIPVLMTTISLICNFALFAGIAELTEVLEDESFSDIIFMINILTFVISFIMVTIVNKLVLDLEKKLNPEKRGNMFDTRFARNWEESCDEAQKQILYKSAYKAFSATNITCMILWGIAFAGQFAFHTGAFAGICICIIWLVMDVVFTVTSMKLER